MQFIKIHNRHAVFALLMLAMFFSGLANAQSCTSASTTISTACALQITPASNASVTVTATGSVDTTSASGPSDYSSIQINNGVTGVSITNDGTISSHRGSATQGALGTEVYLSGAIPTQSITSIINNGTISSVGTTGTATGLYLVGNTTVSSITNNGTISATSQGQAVGIADQNGILGLKFTIGTITNNAGAVISGTNTATANRVGAGIVLNMAASSIDTLTNLGTITGSAVTSGFAFGIANYGNATITTLNNAQGVGNANGALTYRGKLPTNYNIIISSTSNFGQLVAYTSSGSMNFGISSLSTKGSSVVGNYSTVLNGVTEAALGATGTTKSGTSNGYSYSLNETAAASNIWNLSILSAPDPVPTGPLTADTQASLVNTATALQGSMTLQNAVMINGFTYDCPVFDKNGVCVSAGGRNTQVNAGMLNNTAGLLIGSYRLDGNNSRVGLSLDQNFTVSQPGGTIKQSNETPMVGVFGVYQENLDNTGWEGKASLAMGQKNTTIQRAIVGTSESGVGSAKMLSQGAQLMAKYGFGVMKDALVLPYAGVRYTRNNLGGYTEASSSAVTSPLAFSPTNTNSSAALIGVEGRYKVMPDVMTYASAGLERNITTDYNAYNVINNGALTPVSMNPNMVRTRPTATLGAYYDIEKNQRLGITGIYRQEMYQAVGTTTVMATYTVGL